MLESLISIIPLILLIEFVFVCINIGIAFKLDQIQSRAQWAVLVILMSGPLLTLLCLGFIIGDKITSTYYGKREKDATRGREEESRGTGDGRSGREYSPLG